MSIDPQTLDPQRCKWLIRALLMPDEQFFRRFPKSKYMRKYRLRPRDKVLADAHCD